MIKKFMLLATLLSLSLTFVSCDEDNGMSDALHIYQEYQVFRNGDNVSVFANFRKSTPAGQRIMLTDGTNIKVNNLDMYYSQSVSEDKPEFNYAQSLSSKTSKVNFSFTRSKNVVLVNSVDISDMPFPEIDGIEQDGLGNSYVKVDLDGADFTAVSLFVVPRGAVDKDKALNIPVSPDGKGDLTTIPKAGYDMYLEYSVIFPTTQNDVSSSGSINVVSRDSETNVFIK